MVNKHEITIKVKYNSEFGGNGVFSKCEELVKGLNGVEFVRVVVDDADGSWEGKFREEGRDLSFLPVEGIPDELWEDPERGISNE